MLITREESLVFAMIPNSKQELESCLLSTEVLES
jgi:hypothetical protein